MIRAFYEEFEIVHKRQCWQGHQILLCRGVGEELYTILCFEDVGVIKALLPFFFPQQENNVFEDYKGCFTRGPEFYVVFHLRKGKPLSGLLQEGALSLEQRIRIGKQLLEKMLLWRLPDFLICQMLQTDYILVNGEEPAFSYGWDSIIPFSSEMGMDMINIKVKELLEFLFEKEIKCGLSTELQRLLRSLEQNEPADFFAIYEAYDGLCDAMPGEARAYHAPWERLKIKLEENAERIIGIIKGLMFLAAYAVVVFLLVKEIWQQKEEEPEIQGIYYESIGDLHLMDEDRK